MRLRTQLVLAAFVLTRLLIRLAPTKVPRSHLRFAGILVFGQIAWLQFGLVLLFGIGFVQSFCLTPLAAIMLRSSDDAMRGRVMGVRMLAIWGLPLGLLAAGPLIAGIGYSATTLLYGGLGLAATFAIGYSWRHSLWQRSAAANLA